MCALGNIRDFTDECVNGVVCAAGSVVREGWREGWVGEQNRVPRAPASAEPAVDEGLAPHALYAQQEIQRGLVGHWPGVGLHPNEGTQLCLPVTQILSTGEVPSAEFAACGPCVIQVRPSSHHEERTLVH